MEDAEVIVGRTTKQIVFVGGGNEDDREVKWKLFVLVTGVDLPLLATDAESSY